MKDITELKKETMQDIITRLYFRYDIADDKDRNYNPYHTKGQLKTTFDNAITLNNQNYGIFWIPNIIINPSGSIAINPEMKDNQGNVLKYPDGKVKKEQTKLIIKYYFIDIDNDGKDKETKKIIQERYNNDYSKDKQLENIMNLIIKPSMIIETKNGYHCYWKLKEPITIESYTTDNEHIKNWKYIEQGIQEKLVADKSTTNINRLFRTPYFYHRKHPDDSFLVEIKHIDERTFTETEMLDYFKLPEKPKPEPKKRTYDYPDNLKSTNFADGFIRWWLDKYSNTIDGGRHYTMKNAVVCLVKTNQEQNLNLDLNSLIYKLNESFEPPLTDIENFIKWKDNL